ncbi:unnamed protein product [Durusdinium trenchii]|uniref:Uncharacterized protein n=1 Tax=Durusdinium trenchii TaxID=1381693 RepID=A0ABP0PGH7_9DINO
MNMEPGLDRTGKTSHPAQSPVFRMFSASKIFQVGLPCGLHLPIPADSTHPDSSVSRPANRESRDLPGRLFRRLRKPKSAGPKTLATEPTSFQPPREEPRAFEDLGAMSWTDGKGRQRLAGNGLEDLPPFERFDFRDEALEGGFFDLGSSDEFLEAAAAGAAFGAPNRAFAEPVVAPAAERREKSSPALHRHNEWFDGRGAGPAERRPLHGSRGHSEYPVELEEPVELVEDFSPSRIRGRDDLDDLGMYPSRLRSGHSWMTPSRRRKSDPVARGAQLRELWSRDRFLRGSANRKFDLRGCGPPPQASPRRGSRRAAYGYAGSYGYVPLHQRRADEAGYQVRRQMRVPDYP